MATRMFNFAVSTLAVLLAVLFVLFEINHVNREWRRMIPTSPMVEYDAPRPAP